MIAAPIGAFFLVLLAFCLLRRRRRAAGRAAEKTSPLHHEPEQGYNDDYRSMAERGGLNRNLSMRSNDTQPSMATTDILLRGSADDIGGPLRSHPVTMLGSIPQSPGFRADEMASLKTVSIDQRGDGEESEESAGSTVISTRFGNEYMHGMVQYPSSSMRYVTKLDEPVPLEACDVTFEDPRQKSSRKTRHMSWMGLGSFGRHKESIVSSMPGTAGAGEWMAPRKRRQETRVMSMPLMPDGDGGEWSWEEHEKDS